MWLKFWPHNCVEQIWDSSVQDFETYRKSKFRDWQKDRLQNQNFGFCVTLWARRMAPVDRKTTNRALVCAFEHSSPRCRNLVGLEISLLSVGCPRVTRKHPSASALTVFCVLHRLENGCTHCRCRLLNHTKQLPTFKTFALLFGYHSHSVYETGNHEAMSRSLRTFDEVRSFQLGCKLLPQ